MPWSPPMHLLSILGLPSGHLPKPLCCGPGQPPGCQLSLFLSYIPESSEDFFVDCFFLFNLSLPFFFCFCLPSYAIAN